MEVWMRSATAAPLHKLNERLEKSLARHEESSNNLHPEGHASYKAACEEFYSPFPSCMMPRAGSNLSQLSRVSSTAWEIYRVCSRRRSAESEARWSLWQRAAAVNSDPDLDEEADPRFKEVAHLLADMRCEYFNSNFLFASLSFFLLRMSYCAAISQPRGRWWRDAEEDDEGAPVIPNPGRELNRCDLVTCTILFPRAPAQTQPNPNHRSIVVFLSASAICFVNQRIHDAMHALKKSVNPVPTPRQQTDTKNFIQSYNNARTITTRQLKLPQATLSIWRDLETYLLERLPITPANFLWRGRKKCLLFIGTAVFLESGEFGKMSRGRGWNGIVARVVDVNSQNLHQNSFKITQVVSKSCVFFFCIVKCGMIY